MAATLDSHDYVARTTKAAEDQWGKSNDQYNWAKDQFAKNSGITDTVVNRALNTGSGMADASAMDRADYEKNVRPAMQEQMDFARGYNTDARRDANRASAIGGSRLASRQAAKNAEQSLMSFGVDPSSGRFAGLAAGVEAADAARAAAAGTKSDRDTEQLGQQYLANAIKTGQVLPGQALAEAQQGSAQDSLAVNASLANTKLGDETMGNTTKWASLGNDMIKEWLAGNKSEAEVNLAQQKLDQTSSSGTGAMIGALAGAGMGAAKTYASGGFSGFGGMTRRGGRIQRLRAGGPVAPQQQDDRTRRLPERMPHPERPRMPPPEQAIPMEPEDEIPEWLREGTPSPEAPDVPMPEPQPDYRDNRRYPPPSIRMARGGMIGDNGSEISPTIYKEIWEDDPPQQKQGGGIFDFVGGMGGGSDGGMGILPGDMPGSRDPSGGGMGGVGSYDLSSIFGGNGSPGSTGSDWTSGSRYPGDPLYGVWEGLSPDEAPMYDEGEKTGASVGKGIGGAVGSIWGPIGKIAGQEIGDRGGATVGAAVQGNWGEAASDLTAGTPLTFLFDEGGGVTPEVMPEDEFGEGEPHPNAVPRTASPSGGNNVDDVHAMVQVGEFVMPEDVSRWYGEKYFQGLIEKARRDMSTATAQPERSPMPQAMAISPPSFRSEGART